MAIRKALDEKIVSLVAYTVMVLLSMIMLYPLLNVLAVSLSDYSAYIQKPAMVVPSQLTFSAYTRVLSTNLILRGYLNSLFVMGIGTALSITLTVATAYPLAKGKVRGSKVFTFMIVFTMLFQAGMIPTYLLVRSLGLIDSLWALILCQAMTPYNFFIMRANMEHIPDSLEESVKLDGGNAFTILTKIVIPLCIPAIVALLLFYAVAHWNRFFEAVLYINSRAKWTMALILREIIAENPNLVGEAGELSSAYIYPKSLQNATIIITILPIMMVYPFIQRYFISGVMIGSVKE
jgi:putative aldouronate transport system permease protein